MRKGLPGFCFLVLHLSKRVRPITEWQIRFPALLWAGYTHIPPGGLATASTRASRGRAPGCVIAGPVELRFQGGPLAFVESAAGTDRSGGSSWLWWGSCCKYHSLCSSGSPRTLTGVWVSHTRVLSLLSQVWHFAFFFPPLCCWNVGTGREWVFCLNHAVSSSGTFRSPVLLRWCQPRFA